MRKIRTAIIGYGLSGRYFHSAIINSLEEFEIVKIVTGDPEKRKLAQEENKDAKIVDNVDDVFNDKSIELVVISTPNTSHYNLALHAIETNKHVIIEKPFTVTSEKAQKLIDISKVRNRVLSVYQNRRFDGDYKTVKEIIAEEYLGRLVEYESHFDRFVDEIDEKSWREDKLPGSGVLYDLGPHLIDQALDLFGLPNELYADIRSQRRGGVDDNFELILYYEDLKVSLKASSLVKEELPRFILHGTKGSYIKYGLDIQEEELIKGKRPKSTHWGQDPVEFWGTLNTIYERKTIETKAGDYRDYYKNIYGAIVNDEELIVKASDVLNVIKVIELAIKSNEEKRRLIFK